jgi:hypothetical protein
MTLRYVGADTESDDRALLQYELLRLQVVDKQGAAYERNLGLALFIRQGMLAWIEVCRRSMPAKSNPERRPERPVFGSETTPEMIKVMANITLFNLEETLS